MISENIYREYLTNLLAGDRKSCHTLVSSLLDDNIPIKSIHLDLFQRSMYEVGDLWEHNHIPVSVEHLATAITEYLLTLLYPRLFAMPRNGRKAVISCVANEHHQIGGKIVADTLEFEGWDGYYLGADTPTPDLILFIDEKNPDLVGLSLAIQSGMSMLISTIGGIQNAFPRLPVIVGGQAFRNGGDKELERFPNVTYLPSLDALLNYINRHPRERGYL